MDKDGRTLPVSKTHKEKEAGNSRNESNEVFRRIPKIDRIMGMEPAKELAGQYGYTAVRDAAREAEEQLRADLLQVVLANGNAVAEQKPVSWKEEQRIRLCDISVAKKMGSKDYEAYILQEMRQLLSCGSRKRMQRVINATGVILHTNLGRAPLGERLVSELVPLMTGYTNMEIDLEDGKRGSRYDHFASNLCRLTGAEAAIAVNNNAAAVLVMLTALASGGETIVSRGELVEIGGKFRIPDVCSQSGTTLVEVGTTNRTYLQDYENAVTENTAAFLKVHTSNYQITGFTHEPELAELANMAHSREIPFLVDFGSGSLVDMASYGIQPEKTVQELLKKGADIVSFSGDKLLGGPQAGILVGRKDLIEKISKHPLMRALRIDKFTAAALDKTVGIYLDDRKLEEELPVYEMMGRSIEELKANAGCLMDELLGKTEFEYRILFPENEYKMPPPQNPIGGGTTPGKTLPGVALAIRSKAGNDCSAQEVSARLRGLEVPVIGHIVDDWVYLEMRTIQPGEIEILRKELKEI